MGPDTSVDFSSSATLNGEFYVFGGRGSTFNKQVIFLNKKAKFFRSQNSKPIILDQ